MDVVIDVGVDPPTVRLDNPEDVRSFRAIFANGPRRPDLSTVADFRHEEFLWIPATLVEELAAGHVAPGWDDEFDAMIRFAESKGWYDDRGRRIRAHCEWA